MDDTEDHALEDRRGVKASATERRADLGIGSGRMEAGREK